MRTHIEDTHWGHTLRTHIEDTHWGHTLRTHSEDKHWEHTLRTHIEGAHDKIQIIPFAIILISSLLTKFSWSSISVRMRFNLVSATSNNVFPRFLVKPGSIFSRVCRYPSPSAYYIQYSTYNIYVNLQSIVCLRSFPIFLNSYLYLQPETTLLPT